jgi:hypothetical protein
MQLRSSFIPTGWDRYLMRKMSYKVRSHGRKVYFGAPDHAAVHNGA